MEVQKSILPSSDHIPPEKSFMLNWLYSFLIKPISFDIFHIQQGENASQKMFYFCGERKTMCIPSFETFLAKHNHSVLRRIQAQDMSW